MNEVTWTTPAGRKYTYTVHPIAGTQWSNAAGNYAFAYQGTDGLWYALYVGQTNDFAARFSNHEKLRPAINKGATHILAHVNANDQARKSEEAELITWLRPVCNELLK